MKLAVPLARIAALTLSSVFVALAMTTSSASAFLNEAPAGLSAADWAGLREAHGAKRFAIFPTRDGYQARNPAQRWTLRFDGRGFEVDPDTGDWTWGLELGSYGYSGGERVVTEALSASTTDGLVTYEWGAGLEEWYVNDESGLEHGYTVYRRPPTSGADTESRLRLTLGVRGELRPEVVDGGRGVRFLDRNGVTALTYTGLCVFDADGRELEAGFSCTEERLHVSIDERGARYPLTVDPIAQQAYVKASNTDDEDVFGYSVAVSGDTVVIGAPGESSGATGIDGDQNDNSSTDAGAAYVFVRNGASWNQQAYLKASNTDSADGFGLAVAVSGDTVVIGAPYEDSGATGVDGDQDDDSASQAGAAYVFMRSGTTWVQQAYLKASNTGPYDQFGWSVAISGDRAIIAAHGEASNATGVDGDQSDNSIQWAGAVYAFARSGTTWTQEAYLKASNTEASDYFGHSVALSGNTAVVSALKEDSSASDVNGDQNDNGAYGAGAAYVFERTGSSWSQQAYLKASNTEANDAFGFAVGVTGDTVVIGAIYEDSNATGIDGDQHNELAPRSGAAYLFTRAGMSWSPRAYLKASNTGQGDHFGHAVSTSGDFVVVGSECERSWATGVNGDQDDDSSFECGAAYLFERAGTTWSQRAYLKASNTGAADRFGTALALSDDVLVVGAHRERSLATGVNGDQGDDSGYLAGAGYCFDLDAPPPGVAYCSGDPGSGTACPCNNDNDGSVPGSGCDNGVFPSGAKLSGSGWPSVSGDSLVLACTHLEPNNAGLYFQADNDLSPGIVWGDGLRCAGGSLERLGVRFSGADGSSDTSGLPLPISVMAGNVSAGGTKYYQCWYRTTVAPPCGSGLNDFNTSNGYAVTWLP